VQGPGSVLGLAPVQVLELEPVWVRSQ